MDKFRQGHRACRSKLPPTAEEMKSHLMFYHVPLLRPQACNKLTILASDIMHAPAFAMINHLIWFLESSVEEDQDEHCHYSPEHPFLYKAS
jgi:hypothetical protein